MSDITPGKAENPVIFNITIPWADVESAYQSRLDKLTAETVIEGFRKGNAPRKLVEEKVGKQAIYGDVIQDVLPAAYQKEVESRNLQPIISPRVKPIHLDEQKDWLFEVAVVLKPVVKLNDFEAKLRDSLAPGKIIVPGKKDEVSRDEKMKVAFDTLLEFTEVDLPDLLVQEEVNARLSQFVDQLQAVGMTVDQYLKTKNITADQLRTSYEKTAREMFKINFALDEIASQRGFTEKDRIAKTIDWLIDH